MSIHLLNADCGGVDKTTQAVGEITHKRSLALHSRPLQQFISLLARVAELVQAFDRKSKYLGSSPNLFYMV